MFPSDKGLPLQISAFKKPMANLHHYLINNTKLLQNKVYMTYNRMQVPLEVFLPQNFMQPLSWLCQAALCSAAIDEGKREVCIISPLSYYFFF